MSRRQDSSVSYTESSDSSDNEKSHDYEKGFNEKVSARETTIPVAGINDIVTSNGNIITEDGQVILNDDDQSLYDGKGSKNIFKDPEVAAHYRDLYEKSQYECRHVFDPEIEWTEEEEKAVKWKIEWRVCLLACVMFTALQLDRGNISQALSGTFLKDLHLTTNQYNTGMTIFYLTFLSAELPSQLVSKRVGPDRWIPTQIVLWSLVAISQCKLTGKTGFYITRALLGFLEGGFIPDIVLWLSYFYTSKELPFRLSLFWSTLTTTQIAASLLAFAILHLHNVAGLAGWRWLFLLEGLYSLIIGLASFFLMPASPVQTKSWFRPNGWFSDREVKIVVNRVLRDDPSKGDMHNRQPITFKLLWYSISDLNLWPLYLIGLIAYIPSQTVTACKYILLQHLFDSSTNNDLIFFLLLDWTIVLRSLGFSTFNTNLLSIPPNVIHIVILLIQTWATEYFNERSLISTLQPLWLIPCFAVLIWWKGALSDAWGTYAVLVLLNGAPYIHAILVGWCSKNSNTVRSRTVSASLYNMFVQAGNIVASNVYQESDAPHYYKGNKALFGMLWASLALIILTKVYYIWLNNRRDKIWNAMTEDEQINYRATTKDKGNSRLDFRFAH